MTQANDKKSQPKNDPIMLLMAAAEVVNRQSNTGKILLKRCKINPNPYFYLYFLEEKRKRHSYPSKYYHRKSDELIHQNKRMRTSPPTTPAPSYKPDTWRKNSSRSHNKTDHCGSTKVTVCLCVLYLKLTHKLKLFL